MPNTDRLLTEPEASAFLRVSQDTLFSLRKAAAIPYVRIGKLVRYVPADLCAWIDSRKVSDVPF